MSEGAQQKTNASAAVTVADRASLIKVRNVQGNLLNLISNLSEKLGEVKTDQEKEFLSAYRVHMLNVQKELKELTTKVAKAEEFLQDDSEVSKLEEECQWFRNETNRLQAHVLAMEQDMKHLKSRRSALNEQNKYLSDQLKQTMKRSRVLQTEIDIIDQREREEAIEQQAAYNSHHSAQQQQQQQLHHYDEPSGTSHHHQQQQQQQQQFAQGGGGGMRNAYSEAVLGDSKRHGRGGGRGGTHASQPQLKGAGGGSLLNMSNTKAHEANLEQNIRAALRSANSRGGAGGGSRGSSAALADLNQPPDMLVRKATKTGGGQHNAFHCAPGSAEALLHELENLQRSKTEMEVKIEQYLTYIFNKILERKALHTVQMSKARGKFGNANSIPAGTAGGSRGLSATNSIGDLSEADSTSMAASHILSDTSHNPTGLTGLGLEYFTDKDRYQCMCVLLSDPIVFAQVVEELKRKCF